MQRYKKLMSPISFLMLFALMISVATKASAEGLDRNSRIGVAEFRGQGFTSQLHSWFEFPSADASKIEVWGYTNRTSYAPGDTVNLHISTTAKSYDMIIVRDGGKYEVVLEKKGINGKHYATPKDAYRTGPRWPVAQKLKIPADWKSGGYVVKLQVTNAKGKKIEQQAFFIVRPGKTTNNKIAFVAATQTWQAYNDWGGSNCYEGVEGPEKATSSPAISTQKPWARGQIWVETGGTRTVFSAKLPIGSPPQYPMADFAYSRGYSKYYSAAGWATYESLFARWAERNGYSMDYFAQNDLKGDVLKRYKTVVFVGHDEYHTMADRKVIDNYIEQGGRLIRLAANMIWKSRLENNTLVCYPEGKVDSPWESQATNWPSVLTWGVNGWRGVYVKMGGFQPRATGGFTVYRPKHWALQGTDLYYGDVFGQESAIAGYEGDGLAYTFKYGLPYPTGEDGAPVDKIEIIAMALGSLEEEDHGNPGTNLYGGSGDLEIGAKSVYGSATEENKAKLRYGSTMILNMKKGKGEVFTAASTDWVNGLNDRNPFVEIITRNVLDKYLK